MVLIMLAYLGGLHLLRKHFKWTFSEQPSRLFKRLHFASLLLCCLLSLSYFQYDWGFQGYWVGRLLLLLCVATGLFATFILHPAVQDRVEKWYFRIFSWIPVGVGGLLLLPFLGIVMVLSGLGQWTSPVEEVLFEDQHTKVITRFIGVLGPPHLEAYQKWGIWEKAVEIPFYFQHEVDHVWVDYEADSVVISCLPSYIDSAEATTFAIPYLGK